MATRICGEFEVTMPPQEPSELAREAGLHRMSLDKRYRGELEGVGKGEMLAAHGARPDSAGYVALERVTGTLGGKAGSFVILHQGLMDRGTPSLSIAVVPDSGTDGLAGLTGRMGITVADGKHYYDFEYDLPEAP
ncbi:DUF3224 domain-containing protein [Paludisphaera soli]|uniref:DUF3224 domain-containing protein n=1 Tax=Paludisphaera soli TaxID=2712865 RepID=UPI0013EC4246|nr:DUF3224 domain-containing protein [Paludisphaera soli]